jgi:hypothetical protein
MKIDYDILRQLLIYFDKRSDGSSIPFLKDAIAYNFPNIDVNTIFIYAKKLIELKLVTGKVMGQGLNIGDIKESGRNLLRIMTDTKIWDDIEEKLNSMETVSFEQLAMIAKEHS